MIGKLNLKFEFLIKKNKKMKKILSVFALAAVLASCGDSAEDIVVNDLDSPCACAEAGVLILQEMTNFKADAEGASEAEMKDLGVAAAAMEQKLTDLQAKCTGDLAPMNAKDCPAVEKMQTLANDLGL